MTRNIVSRLLLLMLLVFGVISTASCAPNIERLEQAQDVEGLVKALNHPDIKVRGAAVTALGKIGAPAVESLIAALDDADVREPAAAALSKIGAPAVEPLVTALRDKSAYVREPAAVALRKIGAPAVEPLIAALKDEDVRSYAAETLGEIGDPRAVEPLIAALKDEDYSMVKAATRALGMIGAPAVEPLIAALKDKDDYNATIAARAALDQIGAPAVEPLIVALKDEDIRSYAAAALEKLGWKPDAGEAGAWYWIAKRNLERASVLGSPAIAPLIAVLRDKDADVREAAAVALGEIGDPQAVELLIAALKDEDYRVRDAATRALGKIGDPRAVEPLAAALMNGHVTAAAALGEIGASAVEPLIKALKATEWSNVPSAAAAALGETGDPRAVEPLVAALKNKAVRANAAAALGRIGAPAVESLVAALKDDEVRADAAGALDTLGWKPDNGEAGAWYWIAKRDVEKASALGSPAIAPLIAALKDRTIRDDAAKALEKLDWKPDEGEVAAWYWITKRDSEKASALGTPATGPLIAALKDADVRDVAAAALSKIGAPAVEPLIATLEDDDKNVREAAAVALGKIGAPAVEPLIAALKNGLGSAATALGKIGAPAVEPLIDILRHENSDTWTYKLARSSLVEICDDEPAVCLRCLESESTISIYDPLIRLGLSGTENALVEALNSFGTKGMAVDYLNCGNQVLESAASSWARDHGYMILTMPGSGGIQWGQK